MRNRGFTLIEQMIAVAIIGIGAGMWHHFDHYRKLTNAQRSRETLVRVLENEIELAVACPDRACLVAWSRGTSDDSLTWGRTKAERSWRAGPAGTSEIVVSASIPGTDRTMRASRLVWSAR